MGFVNEVVEPLADLLPEHIVKRRMVDRGNYDQNFFSNS